VFLYFHWNNYRAVGRMMKCHGLKGSLKQLTINSGRGRRVHFLACLHLRLNLWDHWKLNKYHLTTSGHICLPLISQLGMGSRLNIASLIISDSLIIKHNKNSMSERKYWERRRQLEWVLGEMSLRLCQADASELRPATTSSGPQLPHLEHGGVMSGDPLMSLPN
jgi:hypothetical protein